MKTDDKLLIARTLDLFDLCEKYASPRFSPFLDGGELAVIEDNVSFPYGYNVMLWGGYEGAERKIIGVFPDWSETDTALFPITALLIKNNGMRELSHRDYLGTVMSLGIDRSKMGDIVVNDDGSAYLFFTEDIADYVADNITKIANSGVSVSKVLGVIEKISPKLKPMSLVCASLRADAVIAAALKESRQTASRLIGAGNVKINHRPITDGSKPLKEGDLISVRGYGRYILSGEGANTRKGRIHITVNKFI